LSVSGDATQWIRRARILGYAGIALDATFTALECGKVPQGYFMAVGRTAAVDTAGLAVAGAVVAACAEGAVAGPVGRALGGFAADVITSGALIYFTTSHGPSPSDLSEAVKLLEQDPQWIQAHHPDWVVYP
jgi:hypothetical protein